MPVQRLALSPALFERFSALLAGAAGLQFEPSKLRTLQVHLHDRARHLHCTSLEDYFGLLTGPQANRDELRRLIETVTIHETSFFRNHEHYRAVRELVLPELAGRNAATRRLRIWSAGCSTGEEPYSLAIACREQPELAGWDIRIEATDLSESVLGQAQRGMYRAGALRYIEPERVARWFRRQTLEEHALGPRRATGPLDPLRGQREVFVIADELRRLVHFQPLNLAQLPYPETYAHFDLIVCENVIIYLQPDLIPRIIDAFYERLQPGGFLFLGYSETLWQISDRFGLITRPNTFYYQRPLVEPPPRPARDTPASSARIDLQELLRKLSETPPPSRPGRAPVAGESPGRERGTREGKPAAQPPAATPGPVRHLDAAVAIALAERLVRQAHADLEAGRYAEAQAAFAAALVRNPGAVDALAGLAQIHANQGRLAEALAECAKALDIDALCEDAHLLSALIARQQGRLADAGDHLEKLLYINGESVAGHYHLAETYLAQQRAAEATREYHRTLWALDRHPGAGTISGLPVGMIRRACEQKLGRLRA